MVCVPRVPAQSPTLSVEHSPSGLGRTGPTRTREHGRGAVSGEQRAPPAAAVAVAGPATKPSTDRPAWPRRRARAGSRCPSHAFRARRPDAVPAQRADRAPRRGRARQLLAVAAAGPPQPTSPGRPPDGFAGVLNARERARRAGCGHWARLRTRSSSRSCRSPGWWHPWRQSPDAARGRRAKSARAGAVVTRERFGTGALQRRVQGRSWGRPRACQPAVGRVDRTRRTRSRSCRQEQHHRRPASRSLGYSLGDLKSDLDTCPDHLAVL